MNEWISEWMNEWIHLHWNNMQKNFSLHKEILEISIVCMFVCMSVHLFKRKTTIMMLIAKRVGNKIFILLCISYGTSTTWKGSFSEAALAAGAAAASNTFVCIENCIKSQTKSI